MDLSLNRLSLEECGENETFDEDRISELPDDILVQILAFGTTKQAVRTSSLSKRWRSLWVYTPGLNFDCEVVQDSEDKMPSCMPVAEKYLKGRNYKFVSRVDQVLTSHMAPTIDAFKVKYDLLLSKKDKVDNWISFAAEKRVKRLELDAAAYYGIAYKRTYTFPSLRFCSLTFLQLVSVRVSGEVLEELLSDCPTLEILSVNCSPSLVKLKVVGPSLRLKSLRILYCFDIKHLEISAPNLKVFDYRGPVISSPFKSIPELAELSFSGYYADYLLSDFSDLSSFISQIKVLTIKQFLYEPIPEVYPIFMRLKILDIQINTSDDVELYRLRFLLQACLVLHRFVLRFTMACGKSWKTGKTGNVKVSPHDRLKTLEMVEFRGCDLQMAFVRYLMKTAVSLEKMIIEPICSRGRPEMKVKALKMAEVLRSELKPDTMFQIRD